MPKYLFIEVTHIDELQEPVNNAANSGYVFKQLIIHNDYKAVVVMEHEEVSQQ